METAHLCGLERIKTWTENVKSFIQESSPLQISTELKFNRSLCGLYTVSNRSRLERLSDRASAALKRVGITD
jgi:hypothetical protein